MGNFCCGDGLSDTNNNNSNIDQTEALHQQRKHIADESFQLALSSLLFATAISRRIQPRRPSDASPSSSFPSRASSCPLFSGIDSTALQNFADKLASFQMAEQAALESAANRNNNSNNSNVIMHNHVLLSRERILSDLERLEKRLAQFLCEVPLIVSPDSISIESVCLFGSTHTASTEAALAKRDACNSSGGDVARNPLAGKPRVDEAAGAAALFSPAAREARKNGEEEDGIKAQTRRRFFKIGSPCPENQSSLFNPNLLAPSLLASDSNARTFLSLPGSPCSLVFSLPLQSTETHNKLVPSIRDGPSPSLDSVGILQEDMDIAALLQRFARSPAAIAASQQLRRVDLFVVLKCEAVRKIQKRNQGNDDDDEDWIAQREAGQAVAGNGPDLAKEWQELIAKRSSLAQMLQLEGAHNVVAGSPRP